MCSLVNISSYNNEEEEKKEYALNFDGQKVPQGKKHMDDEAPIVINTGLNQPFQHPKRHIELEKSILEGDELIANPQEIQKYKELVNCKICTEILVLSREPQFCFECQTSVFCKACIEQCLSKKNLCPFCQHPDPRMIPINDNP